MRHLGVCYQVKARWLGCAKETMGVMEQVASPTAAPSALVRKLAKFTHDSCAGKGAE